MKPNLSCLLARRWATLAAAACTVLLTPLVRADKPGSGTASYSGRAVAFHIDGVQHPTPGPIVVVDTGALPAAGGVLERHAADLSLYGGALTVDVADATCTGVGPETVAETRLTHYHAHFITHDGKDVVIEAAFIGAAASVSVNPGGHVTADANVVVQGLTVNGHAVAVSGKANQVVNLADDEVRLIINEQTSSAQKGSGDIAVAAIHFYICECMEGHFGLVSAGISADATPPSPQADECGKVTGGGWITGTPSGDKGTFGVSGGIRRGAYWGHLTYIDHGTGMKVESTAVTGFQVDPTAADARIITYAVQIDGAAGTATVRVSDKGEPGRDDTFAIRLSTGYQAGGDLGGSRPGGGNIQIHKCPAGW